MLPARFMLDDLFDEKELKGMGMNADVYQKDNKYHVDVDIPGFNKEDIHIECHKGTITITLNTYRLESVSMSKDSLGYYLGINY